ncbi:cytochrome C peroxidase [Aestuariibacter halophilus]|uniref:Cytochrome C peroxidase n=1 Tax=Fluctibacter halophilus TaxID=226011 RepID=A0ABS8G4C8_9ALTE|nr:cytochrome c peroxidase [Aestuariibacter halophilus]MCC2614961.1 cytochrome C peroxidase [Aestuariibacter halophilus]
MRLAFPRFGTRLLSISCIATSLVFAQQPPPNRPPGLPGPSPQRPDNQLDTQLREVIETQGLIPVDATVPSPEDPKVQLGKHLFYTKNLGGEKDAACVSCHHPVLGGGDGLSLSVGVGAINSLGEDDPDLLGQGRNPSANDDNNVRHLPNVPRHAPTFFNLAFLENALFWDGRVSRLPDGAITTPEGVAAGDAPPVDPRYEPGTSLAVAQAHLPVTSTTEMRGDFLQAQDNDTLRAALSGRLAGEAPSEPTLWQTLFGEAFGDDTIDYRRVAEALASYEQSALFVNSPWQRYLQGDDRALSQQQKQGALLFFNFPQDGGAGCVACHNGPAFTDQRFHLVGFPQWGPGTDEATGQDIGREAVTGNPADRYHFRTPSLLNVGVTAPYGHAGAYATLREVVQHYTNPAGNIARLFRDNENAPFCQLAQVRDVIELSQVSCEALQQPAHQHSRDVIEQLEMARSGEAVATSPLPVDASLGRRQVGDLVAFLHALTDPCTQDRACLQPWILDANDEATFPDNQMLVPHDQFGNGL